MVKTKFERAEVGNPDIAVFRIEGKLGFHENTKIQRLVEECLKRGLRTVVFDFSKLSSLGGGVAKIFRDFVDTLGAKGGKVSFVVTNDIITQFLNDGDHTVPIYRSVLEAISSGGAPAAGAKGTAAEIPPSAEPKISAHELAADASANAGPNVIFMSYDSEAAPRDESPAAGGETEAADVETPEAALPGGEADEIISEIFGAGVVKAVPELINEPASPFNDAAPAKKEDATVVELNRQLKRRILELKTLFSISADFNAVWDRKKLLDIFLLTSIAQGGVESAVFLENQGESFKPAMSKGVEVDALARLVVPSNALGKMAGENNVIPLEDLSIKEDTKRLLKEEAIEYVCPFRTKDGFSGLVLLGKRISGRGMKEEDFEFLRILVNIAQGAYDNALMFEREHERTLGIVKTLISIIEENTLLKGTSEFVSRYVGMVAKNMEYAEEQFKDLIYGTVLRDMGMVKVSDLILRSPRDLTKEEWEIIKKHPEDGAEMLSRMKFSGHVVNIVKTHHERFNGEGYPQGLRGKEIPLGSRIISVVESYAAMIHERPTRPALSAHEALDTLKENFGLRYDREVVLQFARIMEKEIAQSVRSGVVVS
jgi:HD-GYP domain-containing protein (c-di-GMP phosphodiesterase class II)/anti-anti-sigma regulatory factor